MDIAAWSGLLLGPVLIIWGITDNGAIGSFIDVPSLLIVVGGTLAAVLINYPLENLKGLVNITKKVFMNKGQRPQEVISVLVLFAEKARREGLLALESEAQQVDDDFLQKGIQLVVDGTDPELVRSILETELSFLEDRHAAGYSMYEAAGALAPAFGMIGTLIGLINMLVNLSDPSAIGPGMAVALITTFYGALLANLFFIPMAGKLKVRSEEEVLIKQIMIEGILSVQAGENPRIVEEKMKAFLAPKMRDNLKEKREGE